MLALNIGRRSFGGLLGSLDYDQQAPVLFLWSVKATTLAGGMNEYSLRLVSLLGGILLPWVVWRMAGMLAGTAVALIATALAAVSVPLIYYAGELKPYGIDALVCAALILLTLRARAAPDRPSSWWHLALGGFLGILLSLPAPFILAGAVAALPADSGIRAAALARKRMAVVVLSWVLCFVALYAAVYRVGSASAFLRRYWEGTFLDPRAPDFLQRLFAFGSALTHPLTPVPGGVQMRWRLAALAVGLLLLLRRAGLPAALQIGVPILALAAAAALGQYAVTDRLLLALAPCVFVALAVLLAELFRLLRVDAQLAGPIGMLLVLGAAAPLVIANGRAPVVSGEGRESARFILRASRGQPVYVLARGLPAWAYYSTDWSRPDLARLDRLARPAAARDPPVFDSRLGLLELIGSPSGVAWREPVGFVQPAPDSGWARNEVARIASVARPHAWIYGAHGSSWELPSLRAELSRRGIVVVEALEERLAAALRIRVR